jgi:GNAT superfamily N-acetyltransferase
MSAMIQIRHAHIGDLPSLAAVRYHDKPAIHRDRIQQSSSQTMHYYIAAYDRRNVGFGVLLLEEPAGWTNSLNRFPILADLFVAEAYRGRGVGRALILHMEAAARQHGASAIYLGVEPIANPRAHQLYLRLGYTPLQEQPYHNTWRFVDSAGVLHEGEESVIDMRKELRATESG